VPQELFATTEILPAGEPATILIEVVPCPEEITEPAGTDQV
jgi:hypothetical protein